MRILRHMLLLLPLLVSRGTCPAQDRAFHSFTLKSIPFAGEGVVDPVDMLVDDHGFLWLLDQRSSYCLMDDRPVRVHNITGTDHVLGWAGQTRNALVVRTTSGRMELPLEDRPDGAGRFILTSADNPRHLLLPNGQEVHLTDTSTLVITWGQDTLVLPLADDHHGPMFRIVPGAMGRLLFDPGNGIWVLGENGLVLASPLDPIFRITDVPGNPGKVTQVRLDPANDQVAVLSHVRGLFFQRKGTGASLGAWVKDQQGNPIGGVKWWTVRGRDYIHGAHQVQEVDLANRTASTILDLRTVLPEGSSLRINNFEADERCRYMYIGTIDNFVVVHDPETGRSVARELMPKGSYSGINLVYEIGLFSNDRGIVISEHDLFLVDGMDGPLRRAREEWPSFRFGPRFRPSSVRVVGDTLVAIASFANGMYLYHIAKDSLYRPIGTDVDRLEIVDLFLDGETHIYGTCNDGLLLYSLADNTCRMIGVEHGLPMENLHYQYMRRMAPGEMALGLTDRFTTFTTADLLGDTRSVHVVSLQINGSPKRNAPYLPLGTRLALGPQENNISFSLSAPLHMAHPLSAYAVRLAEAPEDVRFLQVHEVARFFNLAPGEQTVQFALSPKGPFVDLMSLSIAQPLWKRGWFIAIVVAVVLTVLLVLFSLRMRHVRQEAMMKATYDARIAQLELSSLRARMHPHFIFNSLNSIKSFIAANEPRTATRYLNKFALLVRSILNDSGRAEVELRSELKGLELYLDLERMRFDGSFDLDLRVDPAIDPDRVLVPPLIVQPYAENAIWHGLMHKQGARKLTIRVSRENGTLHIMVRDNGIGRDASRALNAMSVRTHRSLGMSITEEVIARSGAGASVEVKDLHASDGSPAGTEVHIRIPYRTT
ncbi:MAG: histidine kinase [Flavobacteriales bacterium]|nr:histidine kinase [Flavobacteriales bacterium]